MIAYVHQPIHCADCDLQLIYGRVNTEFGKRPALAHPKSAFCKYSGQAFYIPKIDLTEMAALSKEKE